MRGSFLLQFAWLLESILSVSTVIFSNLGHCWQVLKQKYKSRRHRGSVPSRSRSNFPRSKEKSLAATQNHINISSYCSSTVTRRSSFVEFLLVQKGGCILLHQCWPLTMEFHIPEICIFPQTVEGKNFARKSLLVVGICMLQQIDSSKLNHHLQLYSSENKLFYKREAPSGSAGKTHDVPKVHPEENSRSSFLTLIKGIWSPFKKFLGIWSDWQILHPF